MDRKTLEANQSVDVNWLANCLGLIDKKKYKITKSEKHPELVGSYAEFSKSSMDFKISDNQYLPLYKCASQYWGIDLG